MLNTHETAYLVKAFTQDPKQGNPAGVILNAEGLTDEEMVRIAAQLGFSESAFVRSSQKADFRVSFFSPTQEVGLCAHATIATFHLLNEHELLTSGQVTQETKTGILGVTIAEDGLVTMEQTPPQFLEIETNRRQIAELLSITETDLLEFPLQTVSTGTPKMMIPVRSLKILHEIKPNLDGIKEYCQQTNCRGFYPFTLETLDAGADFHARQFNPLAGINEDPITGVAAGALACYAQKYSLSPKTQFVVEQGYQMGKGGNIFVNIDNGVKVGGYAVTYGETEVS